MRFAAPREALGAGITVIYQELSLVPALGADANIYLGMELGQRGMLDRRAMRAGAAEALRSLGYSVGEIREALADTELPEDEGEALRFALNRLRRS